MAVALMAITSLTVAINILLFLSIVRAVRDQNKTAVYIPIVCLIIINVALFCYFSSDQTDMVATVGLLIILIVALIPSIIVWASSSPFSYSIVQADVASAGTMIQNAAVPLFVSSTTTQPVWKTVPFDASLALIPGQKKGFSVSMYLGIAFGKELVIDSTVNVPLFIRSDSSNLQTDTYKFGANTWNDFVLDDTTCPVSLPGSDNSVVSKKCPLIWMVLDKPTMPQYTGGGSANVTLKSNAARVYFKTDFNQTRPESGVDLMNEIEGCKSVDPLTTSCTFFKGSNKFEASSKYFNMSLTNQALTHVAFVFSEDTAYDSELKVYKDMLSVSVFVDGRLSETHSYNGRVFMSSNTMCALPQQLMTPALDPNSGTARVLSNSRLARVQYFDFPLTPGDIQILAKMSVSSSYSGGGTTPGGNQDENVQEMVSGRRASDCS